MHDIANNRYLQTGKILLMVADRIQVEHRLGRVFVLPVAGVQYANTGSHMLGKEMRAATVLMTDYKHINLHRFEIMDGIEQ